MTFRDFFNRFKVLTFVLYAIALSVLLLFVEDILIGVVLSAPLFLLGLVILLGIFLRRDGHLHTVRAGDEEAGSVRISARAIEGAARMACKEIKELEFRRCAVSSGDSGLHIRLYIKILYAKLLETSEIAATFVKELVETELEIKVEKIDVVVVNTEHHLRVEKITDKTVMEQKAVYGDNKYLLGFTTAQKVYQPPVAYTQAETHVSAADVEKEFLKEDNAAHEAAHQENPPPHDAASLHDHALHDHVLPDYAAPREEKAPE
jgi:uncharacterized alkaline shock family protein YloU